MASVMYCYAAFVAFLDNAVSGIPSTCYPTSAADEKSFTDAFQSLVSTAEAIISWTPDDASILLNCVRCIQVYLY
jgi:hypothetical protein